MSILKRVIPLLDRVLIQRVKAVERTKAGIFIPEKSQETLNEGIVVSVGPGSRDDKGTIVPCSVAAGDSVLLPPYGGNVVKLGEEEYLLFRDSEILAKLEK